MRENPKFKGVYIDNDGNEIEGTEFIGWHSRSIAVVALIRSIDNKFALVERRGEGCPDNVGKYCMPCGYLNWDETLKEALIREVYEEIGLKLDASNLTLSPNNINDNTENNLQNVSVLYNVWLPTSTLLDHIATFSNSMQDSKERGGEANEVSGIFLVDKTFVDDHINEFAFNHGNILLEQLVYN